MKSFNFRENWILQNVDNARSRLRNNNLFPSWFKLFAKQNMREYGFPQTCIPPCKDGIVDFVLIRENACQ